MITEEFINNVKKIYSNKFYFTETKYIKYNVKIIVRCKEHNEIITKLPAELLRTDRLIIGCKKCVSENRSYNTYINFIDKSKIIHNNKFAYCLLNPFNFKINQTIKVKLICKDCNNVFEINANNHISEVNRSGCPKCSKNNTIKRLMDTKNSFIKKAEISLGEKFNNFDYSNSIYISSKKPIEIFCKQHNRYFTTTPNNHISKHVLCEMCSKEDMRLKMEQSGAWLPISLMDDFRKYRLNVMRGFAANKKILYKTWNNTCYYSGEYINKSDSDVDHKISVYYGFINNIPVSKISDISNLAICSSFHNRSKSYRTESEYFEILNNRDLNV